MSLIQIQYQVIEIRCQARMQTGAEEWGSNVSICDEMYIQGQSLSQVTSKEQIEASTMHGCIGALTFKNKRGKYVKDGYGTGFLVSSDMVLTCAHNVYDQQSQSFNFDFVFYPGACGKFDDPYPIISYRFPQERIEKAAKQTEKRYINLKSVEYDYALMKLACPVIRDECMVLCLNFLKLKEAKGSKLALYGYPTQSYRKNWQQQELVLSAWQSGVKQAHKIKGSVDECERERKLEYELITAAGQSGSPVVAMEGERDCRVVAMHKAGNIEKGLNVGRLITLDMLTDLEQWRQQMQGESFKVIDLATDQAVTSDTLRIMGAAPKVDTDMVTIQLEELASIIGDLSPSQQQQRRIDGIISSVKEALTKATDLQRLFEQVGKQQQETLKLRESNHGMEKRIKLLRRSSEFKRQVALAKIAQIQAAKPFSFQWDINTPNAPNFSFEGKKVTLLANKGQQAVSLNPMPQKPVTITFQVHNYGDDPIILGILTDVRKDHVSSDGGKDSVGYVTDPDLGKGLALLQGSLKKDYDPQLFIEEGGQLKMEIDLLRLEVAFTNKEKTWRWDLPEGYRDRNVYIFVTISGKGGCIEVLE